MRKVFDVKQLKIRKVKECAEIAIKIDSKILDTPFAECINCIREIIKEEKNKYNNKYVYYIIDVCGEATKEDIEDIYNFVEMALTYEYCTELKEEKRMGVSTLPSVNLRALHLLSWVNSKVDINGFGFEVGKENKSWKKRMVK